MENAGTNADTNAVADVSASVLSSDAELVMRKVEASARARGASQFHLLLARDLTRLSKKRGVSETRAAKLKELAKRVKSNEFGDLCSRHSMPIATLSRLLRESGCDDLAERVEQEE